MNKGGNYTNKKKLFLPRESSPVCKTRLSYTTKSMNMPIYVQITLFATYSRPVTLSAAILTATIGLSETRPVAGKELTPLDCLDCSSCKLQARMYKVQLRKHGSYLKLQIQFIHFKQGPNYIFLVLAGFLDKVA